MTPPPATDTSMSTLDALSGMRAKGSMIFMRASSGCQASTGTELILNLPDPSVMVARATAVFRFPLVLMTLTIVSPHLRTKGLSDVPDGDVPASRAAQRGLHRHLLRAGELLGYAHVDLQAL